jgi:bacillithiol system protein YtxJ
LDEVESFLRERPALAAFVVHVRSERPLSQEIAARSGVPHESPQAIVLRNGTHVWSASHRDITVEALAQHVPRA